MRIISLSTENTKQLANEAARIIQAGGVVLYPTDTLYGLGADALSNEAVDKIYAIKGRDPKKPMHAIVRDLAMVERYGDVTEEARRLAARFWPGPLTLVLKKKPDVVTGIARDLGTVGVRVPNNQFCVALSEAFGGPITTTSANVSRVAPASSPEEILKQLGEMAQHIALVVDAGVLPESKPSTIVDLSSLIPTILREGAVSLTEIDQAFQEHK